MAGMVEFFRFRIYVHLRNRLAGSYFVVLLFAMQTPRYA